MTRREFEEDITTWDELIRFCYDNELCSCEDIVDYNGVLDCIIEDARNCYLDRIIDEVSEIRDPNAEYFYRDYNGDFESLDDYDDFERYKSEVAEEYEEYFDEEVDEENEEDSETEDEPEFDYEEFEKFLAVVADTA